MAQIPTAPPNEQVTEKISYDEFLKKYSGVHAEWVDGEVIQFMTASDRHQDLADWLTAILRFFIEIYDLGWIRSAPFNMQLPHLNRGREPDILFVGKDRLHIVRQAQLAEAADLVVEITSPESIGRDRGDKFVEYEAAGVREYWLIDPDRKQAEFYQLAENGRYQPATLDDDGRFHSTVLPGFWLKVDWLWEEPLLKLIEVVRQLGLLER
jgi:Uma2 family endonuclease